MHQPATEDFYQKFLSLLETTIPGYIEEGKANLTIAIGCTGGQHRSVALAQRLAHDLDQDYKVDVTHREIWRYKGGSK